MNIAVAFGSRTTEHDVSIITGITILEELRKIDKYTVTPLYITKSGIWEFGGNLDSIEKYRKGQAKGKMVSVLFTDDKKLTLKEEGVLGKTHKIDLVVTMMHGMMSKRKHRIEK